MNDVLKSFNASKVYAGGLTIMPVYRRGKDTGRFVAGIEIESPHRYRWLRGRQGNILMLTADQIKKVKLRYGIKPPATSN